MLDEPEHAQRLVNEYNALYFKAQAPTHAYTTTRDMNITEVTSLLHAIADSKSTLRITADHRTPTRDVFHVTEIEHS